MTATTPSALGTLTPFEMRAGLWYKREDTYRLANGCNGSKLRACRWLIQTARERGARHVISAASVLSPQSAMAASLAREEGMFCTVIVGGTTPEKARRHVAIRLAAEAGAHVTSIAVGYNPALQSAARHLAEADAESFHLPYGITTPPGATLADVAAFTNLGARQVENLPREVRTLLLPFGSGNTAAGVLTGLTRQPGHLERVTLYGIGPDRREWLAARLADLGVNLAAAPFDVEHVALHPTFATYGDRMPETADGIAFHPTYEGKIVRYLNATAPDHWTTRDGSTALWVVGGPLTGGR